MNQFQFIIAFTLINFSSLCQKKDTIFLERNTYFDKANNYTIYNVIYIDSSYTSGGHKSLIDFGFSKFDSTTYFEELKGLKKDNLKTHYTDKKFSKKWIALYQYKGEFYTYHPSEFGNRYKFQITDTTTMDFTMEGPEPSVLLAVRQMDSNKFEFTRKNYWQGHKLTITIIDTAKGIAIFEFSPTKYIPHVHKQLMVSAEKAHLFKTIVNYCKTDKVPEFEFEKVNFERLEKIDNRQH